MARNPVQFHQPQRIPSLYGTEDQDALYQWDGPMGFCARTVATTDAANSKPQAPTVQSATATSITTIFDSTKLPLIPRKGSRR